MAKKKLYSYVKNPFCKNGWYSLGFSMAAFLLTQAVCLFAVKRQGDVGMTSAALGISAVLIDLVSFIYINRSFKEKKKNYVFAVISLIAAIFVLVEWVYILGKA